MVTTKNLAANFCAFLLVLVIGIAGCTPKGPRALGDGRSLIEKGRYAEAVEKLTLATSLMRTNAGAWNYLGLAYHHNGQSTNAEQAYLKALSLDRNLAEAHYNLGCLRLEEQHFDGARAELIAFTALRANSVEGWLRLASAQLKLRELPAAEKSYNEALRLDRENSEALNGLGVIQLQRRDPREAARLFASALKAQPDYAPALLNLAIVNQNLLNNRPLALQKYREYLALPSRPENWQAVNALAQALDQELNPQLRSNVSIPANPVPPPRTQTVVSATPPRPATNAAPQVAAVTKPEPANVSKPVATHSASAPTETMKLPPEPVAKSAQDVNTGLRPATNITRVAAASPPRAESSAGTNKPGFLRQLNPMNLFRHGATNSRGATPTPLPKLADSNEATAQKPTEAASAFPRYKYRNPPKPASGDSSAAERAFLSGAKAQQAGRFSEAIRNYTEATQLDPAYFDAYYNLGWAAMTSGNLSQALTAYETALAIRPDSLDARYNFAVALKQGNYLPDSMRELETVLAKYPNEARAHIALGNLYAQQLRQPAKAKEHYSRALELDPRHPQAPNIRFWLNSH